MRSIIDWLLTFREQAGEFITPFLPAFKIIAAVILVFLIWGIIYCISRSSWLVFKIDRLVDVLGAGDLARMRSLRGWRRIQKKIKSDNMADWKTAITNADDILDDILKSSGIQGETIDDRFKQISAEFISNVSQIQEAHQLRRRIDGDPNLIIRKEDVLAATFVYQKAFEELKLID